MHVLVFPRCRLHSLSGRPDLMGPSLIKRRNKIKIEFWIFRKTLKLLAQFRWTFLKVSLLLTVPLLRNPWWLSLSLWVGLECSLVFQALHKLSLQFCLPLLWVSVIYSSPACYLTDPPGHQTLGLFLFSPFIRSIFCNLKEWKLECVSTLAFNSASLLCNFSQPSPFFSTWANMSTCRLGPNPSVTDRYWWPSHIYASLFPGKQDLRPVQGSSSLPLNLVFPSIMNVGNKL